MPDWLRRHLPDGWSGADFLIATVALTATTFVISLVAVALVLVRLPADYFLGDHPAIPWEGRHPFIRWPALVGKNVLGALLIALGVIMSLPGVPGQGILTVLIGAMLIDFPGKRRFEKWLLRRRGVLSNINKLRARYGRAPLLLDTPAATA